MSLYSSFKKLQSGPFMIGIAVFGVLTFTITYAFNMTFARDPKKEALYSVTLPSGKKASFTEAERSFTSYAYSLFFDFSNQGHLFFLAQRGGMNKLAIHVLQTGSWIQNHLAGPGARKKEQKTDEVLQMLLVNAVARDRGIDVATAEVADWLKEAFDNADQYKQLVGYLNLTYPQFETVVREALLYRRALDLLLAQTPLPSGDEIVAEWCERNERFTFQVASFSAEAKKKEMKADLVTDEELKKWFADKKEFEKQKFQEPDKYQVEGLALRNEAMEPGAKFADAFEAILQGITLQDKDAESYFALARLERFKKPAPESKPASAPGSAPASLPAVEYYTFEEKKEPATREVRIARALEKVKALAIEAMAQPGFDLKGFAATYGLTHWTMEAPTPLGELRNIPTYGCTGLLAAIGDVKEGEFFAGYQPAPGALMVTRLVVRKAARVPEAAEIREKLLPDFLDEKSFEKAIDDANAVRDAVLGAPEAELAAVLDKATSARGGDLKTLAPLSKAMRENGEIDFAERTKDASQYLASLYTGGARAPGGEPDPFALKPGALGPPIKNREGKVVYLVRLVERSIPKKEDISAVDYASFKDRELPRLRERKCLDRIGSEVLGKALSIKRRGEATSE